MITPAIAGVPFVVFAQHNNVALLAYLALPAWVLGVTLGLAVTWGDFLFLVWGAPSALALLAGTLKAADDAGRIAGGMCNGVVVLWAVGPTFAVLVLGFVVGLIGGLVVSFCTRAVEEARDPSDGE